MSNKGVKAEDFDEVQLLVEIAARFRLLSPEAQNYLFKYLTTLVRARVERDSK